MPRPRDTATRTMPVIPSSLVDPPNSTASLTSKPTRHLQCNEDDA